MVIALLMLGVFPASGNDLRVASTAEGSSVTCSLATATMVGSTASVPEFADDRSCLVASSALKGSAPIFDLRGRAEFLEFHVPGASHSSVHELAARAGLGDQPLFVYEGGRFRSDALQLCDRLRRVGLAHAKVVDGGIASWAQTHGRAESLAVSRLADSEISAALLDPDNVTRALASSLDATVAKLPNRKGKGRRLVLVADPATPIASIKARLAAKDKVTFYWIGTEERLNSLIGAQHAHLHKREAGPAMPKACGTL